MLISKPWSPTKGCETKLSSQTSQRKKTGKLPKLCGHEGIRGARQKLQNQFTPMNPFHGDKGCLSFTSIFGLIVLKA